jgi:signal transduction histidine kinase/ActR/RegA family two-component response regulator
MTNEFNNEVKQALNSIASLAVAVTPLDVRLQALVAHVCAVLQAPAARLLLADNLLLEPKSWTAEREEGKAQILPPWDRQIEDTPSHPSCQTTTDPQGQTHKLLLVPLMIGNQRLGTIAVAAPAPHDWLRKKSSLLRILAAQVGLVLLVMKSAAAKTTEPHPTHNESLFTEEFLALLSHELRAPLHAILGWVGVLQHPATNRETWNRALKTIERSARAQSHIINDLLDASFCFNHQPNLHKGPVSAQSLLQQVIASVLPVAEQKGIALNADLRLAHNYVLADAERLRQAFWHLLSNALKFTPRNGHIQLQAQRTDDHFEFTLVDSGIGIAPEFMPFVFDPFRQESARTTRKFGGLGLGLAIARHQIELHGGTIEITSAGKNQGVTVVVRLPLEASLLVTQPMPSDVTTRAISNGATTKKDLRGLRVLVVDDDTDSLEIVRTILQNCNSTVQIAVNAREALDVLKRWEPDVMISDIQMPGIDGYELIRLIRQDNLTLRRRIVTIALTAYARPEDRLKALTSGFHTHLSKPIDPTELVAVVASLGMPAQQPFSLR